MGIFTREKKAPAKEDRGFTDTITNALIDAATNPTAAGYIAALEIAAGQLSRAFMSANIEGAGARFFTPSLLGQIGRMLVEGGEAAYYRQGEELRLIRSWSQQRPLRFEVDYGDGIVSVTQANFFLARWNIDADSGLGVSPLGTARTLHTLTQRLEQSLQQESSASVGYLLPIPTDGQDSNVDALRNDIAQLKGRIALVETTRGGWDAGSPNFARDYSLVRMGANIPATSVELYRYAQESVLAACGYPVQLVMGSDGTGQREAWRRYLHGTIAPLARLVEQAASAIGLPITVSFDALFASDIQGRARAFQSLVGAGMSLPEAAAASGILQEQE